jgi:hypothetical protein
LHPDPFADSGSLKLVLLTESYDFLDRRDVPGVGLTVRGCFDAYASILKGITLCCVFLIFHCATPFNKIFAFALKKNHPPTQVDGGGFFWQAQPAPFQIKQRGAKHRFL